MNTIKKPFSVDPANGKVKFRQLDAEEYIKNLQSENSKLHKKIAKLETDCLTYKNRISSLETES
jgi:predicted nuclease with TOPRIM domain